MTESPRLSIVFGGPDRLTLTTAEGSRDWVPASAPAPHVARLPWAGPFAVATFAVALALLRVAGERSVPFQALAHVYVGLLIGLSFPSVARPIRRTAAYAAVAVSLVELAAFLLTIRP